MPELHELGVAAAAAAIRAGEVSAERLVDALVARNAEFARLNAFVSIDGQGAREAARAVDEARRRGDPLGALAGVPLGMKDNIDVVGMACQAGTPTLAGHKPKQDADVTRRLREAGAIFLGKTGMHELALGITNNNPFSGPVRNPYDERMIPGGSSGGAGVSPAARLVPGGIGSDTGGSVRIPAALCGIAALRPTAGRWPGAGIVPIATTRDTAGPMARRVEDLALLDTVVTGDGEPAGARSLKGVRLGVPSAYFWEDLDPQTESLARQALDMLGDAGVELVEASLPGIEALNEAASGPLAWFEPRRDIGAYLRRAGLDLRFEDVVAGALSPDVVRVLGAITSPATAIPEAAYRAAIAVHRPRFIEAYRVHFARHGIDALAFPTTPLPARPIGEDQAVELNGRRAPTFFTYIRNTDPGSVAGLPGISLPIGLTAQGLPVGMALDGLPGADRRLLALAASMEALLPPMPAPRL